MRARKTFAIKDMIARTNTMILRSKTREEREALFVLAATILHEADAYRGFHYANTDGTWATFDAETTDRSLVQLH